MALMASLVNAAAQPLDPLTGTSVVAHRPAPSRVRGAAGTRVSGSVRLGDQPLQRGVGAVLEQRVQNLRVGGDEALVVDQVAEQLPVRDEGGPVLPLRPRPGDQL